MSPNKFERKSASQKRCYTGRIRWVERRDRATARKCFRHRGTTTTDETRGKLSATDKATKVRSRRGLYTFLRNEPKLFSSHFRCIYFRYRDLRGLQWNLHLGSFSENEPILERVLVGSKGVKPRMNPFENRSRVGWCYFFFSPHIFAITASSEKQPGPKMRTMMQVNMKRKGVAVTNLSGLLKMAWAASDSAVR